MGQNPITVGGELHPAPKNINFNIFYAKENILSIHIKIKTIQKGYIFLCLDFIFSLKYVKID